MPHDSDFRAAYQGRRVCVTGGAGFIGSHLCAALLDLGAEIAVIDDLSNGLESNLTGLESAASAMSEESAAFAESTAGPRGRLRFVRGTILSREDLHSAIDGSEVVFHLAAIASVPRSVAEPALYLEVNGTGTLQVLDVARAASVRRVVFAASSSAYGDQPGLPRVETMAPDVRSPYAAAKCAGEYMVRAYAATSNLSAINLRYFNIFGPRQRPDSAYAAVIPLFAKSLLEGRRPRVYGDGRQTRDFTHVNNAVRANLLAGSCPRDLRGETVNIACGNGTSILELIEAMAKHLGVPADCEFESPRAGEVQHSLACIDAARELIDYEPVMSFKDGLAETLEYYRGQISRFQS